MIKDGSDLFGEEQDSSNIVAGSANTSDRECLVVASEVLGLFGPKARFVMMTDRNPQHDVTSVRNIQRAVSIQLRQFPIVALHSNLGTLTSAAWPRRCA